jgi:hypothetical protein
MKHIGLESSNRRSEGIYCLHLQGRISVHFFDNAMQFLITKRICYDDYERIIEESKKSDMHRSWSECR